MSAAFAAPDTSPIVKLIDFELALIMAIWIGTAYFLLEVHAITNGTLHSPEGAAAFAFDLHFLLNTDGRSICPEDLSVTRHQQATAQNIFKGRHNTFI